MRLEQESLHQICARTFSGGNVESDRGQKRHNEEHPLRRRKESLAAEAGGSDATTGVEVQIAEELRGVLLLRPQALNFLTAAT